MNLLHATLVTARSVSLAFTRLKGSKQCSFLGVIFIWRVKRSTREMIRCENNSWNSHFLIPVKSSMVSNKTKTRGSFYYWYQTKKNVSIFIVANTSTLTYYWYHSSRKLSCIHYYIIAKTKRLLLVVSFSRMDSCFFIPVKSLLVSNKTKAKRPFHDISRLKSLMVSKWKS